MKKLLFIVAAVVLCQVNAFASTSAIEQISKFAGQYQGTTSPEKEYAVPCTISITSTEPEAYVVQYADPLSTKHGLNRGDFDVVSTTSVKSAVSGLEFGNGEFQSTCGGYGGCAQGMQVQIDKSGPIFVSYSNDFGKSACFNLSKVNN